MINRRNWNRSLVVWTNRSRFAVVVLINKNRFGNRTAIVLINRSWFGNQTSVWRILRNRTLVVQWINRGSFVISWLRNRCLIGLKVISRTTRVWAWLFSLLLLLFGASCRLFGTELRFKGRYPAPTASPGPALP